MLLLLIIIILIKSVSSALIITKDLNGTLFNNTKCKINVGSLTYPPFIIPCSTNNKNRTDGVEFRLIEAISKKLNLDVEYSFYSYSEIGDVYINGTSTGMYKDLKSSKLDVIFGGLYLTKAVIKYFKNTDYHYVVHGQWCVPRAQLLPQWKLLVRIFTKTAWLIYGLSILTFVLIIHFLPHKIKNETQPVSFVLDSMTGLLLSLGLATIYVPKTTFLRLIFISWVLYFYIVVVTYLSGLTTILNGVIYEKQIKNTVEMLESDLELFVPINNVIRNPQNELEKILKRRLKVYGDLEETIFNVSRYKSSALFQSREFMDYVATKLENDYSEPALYFFNDDLVKRLTTFHISMNKEFVFAKQFNELSAKLLEAGFVNFWYSNVTKKGSRQSSNVPDKNVFDAQLITMQHLLLPIFILAIGYFVAILSFMAEIFLEKKFDNRRPT